MEVYSVDKGKGRVPAKTRAMIRDQKQDKERAEDGFEDKKQSKGRAWIWDKKQFKRRVQNIDTKQETG